MDSISIEDTNIFDEITISMEDVGRESLWDLARRHLESHILITYRMVRGTNEGFVIWMERDSRSLANYPSVKQMEVYKVDHQGNKKSKGYPYMEYAGINIALRDSLQALELKGNKWRHLGLAWKEIKLPYQSKSEEPKRCLVMSPLLIYNETVVKNIRNFCGYAMQETFFTAEWINSFPVRKAPVNP